MYASVNKAIIGSDNGILPGRHQTIIWTIDGNLLLDDYLASIYYLCQWWLVINKGRFVNVPNAMHMYNTAFVPYKLL